MWVSYPTVKDKPISGHQDFNKKKWQQEVNYIDLPAAFNKYDGSFLFLIKKE